MGNQNVVFAGAKLKTQLQFQIALEFCRREAVAFLSYVIKSLHTSICALWIVLSKDSSYETARNSAFH